MAIAREAVMALGRAGLRALPDGTRLRLRQTIGHVSSWEPGARLRPPVCPPGMRLGPPDFVGVGVQKAGTTWWYELLTTHQQVYRHPGPHKERHFFMRFFEGSFGPEEVAEYHRWFPRPPGQITGEWTPDYMLHFWIPRLLKAAVGDARLLVLLRDPVDRFVSGMTHVATRQPIPDARAATEAYLRGRYFEQLDGLGQHFDPERVLVLQYEKCRMDPTRELARTLAFLDLAPITTDLDYGSAVNPTVAAKVALDRETRRGLVDLYRDDVERLLVCYPQMDASLWPNFAFLAR